MFSFVNIYPRPPAEVKAQTICRIGPAVSARVAGAMLLEADSRSSLLRVF
jgi:hypothetical protein